MEFSETTADVEWRDEERGLTPFVNNQQVTWAPLPGSQCAFLSCPVGEVLFTGTRGPGKTDALLMDFAKDVGRGFGADWRGILFRRTFPELQDVIDKSKKWFKKIWPGAEYNEAKSFWRWPTGEMLFFRHFMKSSDYYAYHGHAYPWIAWEELTNWPDDSCYRSMFSCNRSAVKGMPLKIRATTNPYGVGHNWIKKRWRLPIKKGETIGLIITDARDRDGELEPPRVAIQGKLSENKVLLAATPNYIQTLRTAARNKNEAIAWIEGDWDIVAGGMFDDLWDPDVHVVNNIMLNRLPTGWRLTRSYDHGSSKPFSVGWWAISNGEPIEVGKYHLGGVKGDLIRIAEWYGWTGEDNVGVRLSPDVIAQGILEREEDWGIRGRVTTGVADAACFAEYEAKKTVAGDFLTAGIRWLKGDKGPGSRKQGWEQFRKWLKNSKIPRSETKRETPGLFIMERCAQFIRTIPVLPRDDKDLDDVNTDAEDHVGDEVRYFLRREDKQPQQRNM